MPIKAKNHVVELIADLRAIDTDELGRMFVERERDNDLALIGSMSISRNAQFHILVWEGYLLVKESPYAGQ